MSAVSVLSILGGLTGWVFGASTGARSGFLAVVGSVVAFEAASTGDSPRTRSWRRTELLALVVGVKALHMLTVSPTVTLAEIAAFPASLLDPESVAGWVVGMAVWLMAVATVSDLSQIGSGAESAGELPVLDRLRNRMIAVTILLAGAAGIGAVGIPGLLDLQRGGRPGVFWAVISFIGVASAGLARAAYANSEARWRREGAVVDGPVERRWIVDGLAIVAVAAVIAVSFSWGSFSGVPAAGVSRLGPAGEWLSGALTNLGGGRPRPPSEGGGFVSPFENVDSQGGESGSIVGELFILSLLAMAVFVAQRASRRRRHTPRIREGGPSVLPTLVRMLLRGVIALVSSIVTLVRWLVAALFRTGSRRSRAPAPESKGRVFAPWSPVDPLRLRIAVAYRRFVSGARNRGFIKEANETAREFAGKVGVGEPADRITSAYEEARYSAHVIGAGTAERAELDAEEAVNALGR